jgi:short-subunit dehydrogenase
MVAYGATKAFDMIFAEALWAELHANGVDVLSLVLGETDTPALRRLKLRRGQLAALDAPLPGAASVDEVVAAALAKLPDGPSWMVPEFLHDAARHIGAMPRNDAVRLMMQASAETMGSSDG